MGDDNQFAIFWLKQIKEKYIHGGDEEFDSCRKRAIDIAIKELEKPEERWVPIGELLPENAEHPGSFCEKVHVLTVWGESIGWYNPDVKAWFFLQWYSDHGEMVIDHEHGDIPEIVYTPRDTKLITHWKPMVR